ncbi:hypothetical protein P3X46_009478 [Hevea brasiliensis]|uniref:TF-B3 domain-containing protein n=1 Tax=Hevea brasiliensis TaxID=3981 RepID=A0ABQ9MPM0_HEVBR|nr:B3 domain-containing protein At2g36080 [Hevea brasiliensis]KAJ9181340.1 hypothetical protein P3X46_009478 [Hevea brasiliensis]
MSINQFSADVPETLWWAQQHHHHRQSIMEPNPNAPSSKPHKLPISNPNSSWPSHLYPHYHHPHPMFSPHNPSLSFNLNHGDDEEQDPEEEPPLKRHEQQVHQELEKEPMFEKPLTPSDVGKLNRLVIPKQYAEKYFPLGCDSVDKVLLLSFEDELGKFWRFRYSYWSSSQSYVFTKGWSRYVKEKQLDAGDIVLFERHRMDSERLFIGWRRRGDNSGSGVVVQGSSGGVWSRGLYYSSSSSGHQPYQHGHGANLTACVPYQPEGLHAGSGVQNQTIPLGNSKRLRLFGVNLEFQLDESEPSRPDGSSFSSQGPTPQQLYSFHSAYSSSSNSSHGHMAITLSRDVNQTRNHRG